MTQPASNAAFQPFSSHTVFPHVVTLSPFRPSFFKPPKPPHPLLTLSWWSYSPKYINTKKTSIQKTLLQVFISTTSYPDLWVTPEPSLLTVEMLPTSLAKTSFPPVHSSLSPLVSSLKHIHGYHIIIFSLLDLAINNSQHTALPTCFPFKQLLFPVI